MNVTQIARAIVENAISLSLIELSRVGDVIDTSNNQMLNYVKYGALWTLSDELIMMFNTNTSHFQEGHYFILADEVFFNSALFMAIEKSGAGQRVFSVVDNLPVVADLGEQTTVALANGILKLSAKVVQEIIDQKYPNSSWQWLTHPTSKYIGSA